jgi:nitroimidazol reductase NimA-like FMN-containing flavoprotein (pyridoxamine 5'-phosphate oxidase superfamily)
MPRRILEDLSWDECFALLGQETVGRLVYQDEFGPAAVPVNFAVAGHDIIFRSEDGAKIRGMREHPVAFQVDNIDEVNRSGWSVLLRGTGEEVDFERVPELLRRIDDGVPQPWKKGVHKIWVVITPTIVTGRRMEDFAFDDFF